MNTKGQGATESMLAAVLLVIGTLSGLGLGFLAANITCILEPTDCARQFPLWLIIGTTLGLGISLATTLDKKMR